jgi:hypothetical protein
MPDLLTTQYAKKDEANTFTTNQAIAKASQATTAEKLFEATVSDASGSLFNIENLTTTDGHFSPRMWSYYAGAGNVLSGLTIDAYIHNAQDSGTVPIAKIRAALNNGAAITTRPLFGFYDFNTLKAAVMSDHWDFQNNGLRNFRNNEAAKTTNYTLTTADSIIRADASGGAFTLTLPAASGNAGLVYTIIRTDILSSDILLTIDANASETIDGSLTDILYPAETIVLECDGSGWHQISRPKPSHPNYYFRKGTTPNRRYIAGMLLNSTLVLSTTGPTVNTLYAMPFIVSKTTKFDTIECEVTTGGAGSEIRLGIYRDEGNCYPGALMFDSGDIVATAAGAKSATITAGIQIFQPGLYWLTYENSATVPQVRALPGLSTTIPVLGWETPLGVATGGIGYSVAHTVGALPDPYTSGATVRTTSTAAAPVPAVGLRAV